MPTILTTAALEKSTYVVTVTFQDENGNSITPSAVTWSLLDEDGNIFNSRDQISITPAASIDIVLSGDDLAITSTSKQRTVLVEATYSSDLGSNLPLKDEATFVICDLKGVTYGTTNH